jgi:hypothetical protein
MRISDEFVHQTGPPASGEPKVERLVAIIGGHVVGEPIRTSEHVLLEKGNYLSHFYDYKYASTGVKGAATRDKKKIEYIRRRLFSQAEEDGFLGSKSKENPEIPHGVLPEVLFQALKTLVKPLLATRSRLVFTDFDKVLQSETAENREKIMEAYENMKAWPWSDSSLQEFNDYKKQKDQNNADERCIRGTSGPTLCRKSQQCLGCPALSVSKYSPYASSTKQQQGTTSTRRVSGRR